MNKCRLPLYQKQPTRTNCKAKIRVSRGGGGPWRVIYFEKNHNHELVPPEQSYLLRSARNMTHASKSVLEAMHSVGIGVSRACKLMEKESGGPQNVGFTRRDAYAHIARTKRESKLENADANKLIQHFIQRAHENPYFSWDVDFDDDGRILHFFFRDARCAIDYEAFGDVILVDTTYRTNKYNLVCAPFIEINHHAHNVMLGMGFMSDKTTNSFEWLFKAFLNSVNGKQPVMIFTYQCQAMMNAIDLIFPNSAHRLCQWHISHNAPSHLGKLNGNIEFKRMWNRCIKRVETPAEFEELWSHMMTTYELTNDSWFQGMYRLRHRWASVFTNSLFSAGLLATSRSEGTNNALKKLVKSSYTMYDVVRGYEELQYTWRIREKEDDAQCLWMPDQFVRNNRLLTHAATLYTSQVYKSFDYEAVISFNVILRQDPLPAAYPNIVFKASYHPESKSSLNLSFMEDIPVFGYFFFTKSRRITCHSCSLKSVWSQTARKRRWREDGGDYELEEMQRQNYVECVEERENGDGERDSTQTQQ